MAPTVAAHADSHFDWLFVVRTCRLTKILFPGLASLPLFLFLFMLAIALLEQYLNYNVGLISSHYYGVLGSRDYDGFWIVTRNSLLFIVANVFVKSTKTYVSKILYLTWRQLLCTAIHRQYFHRVKYYQVNVLDDCIDNPDQRITQDVDKLCTAWSQIVGIVVVSPFTIAYYTYAAYTSTGYVGPTGCFVFFFVGTIASKLLMSPVVRLVIKQERLEGDFRFKHMQIRSNAESLAFCRGGPFEAMRANCKLFSLIGIQMKLFNWQYGLNMSTTMFDYLGSIVSYLVIAVPIFTGRYDGMSVVEVTTMVSKTSFICMYLINCFSQLVDQATVLTDIAGTTHRISQLVEQLVQFSADPGESPLSDGISSATDDGDGPCPPAKTSPALPPQKNAADVRFGFALANVSYGTPSSRNLLVKDLSLRLTLGNNVLVTGSSSSGKSSLLRVLAKLWPIRSGSIEANVRTYPTDVLFLPQKPYFTDGTLRHQIIYPLEEDSGVGEEQNGDDDDATIAHYMHLADLDHLLDRAGGCDGHADWNWYDVLSPGEMQRLSFIRLFYHKPKMALLDEATSALGADMETVLYKECLRMGITLVSVGHRESLRAFHHVQLHLDGRGGWSLTQLGSPSQRIDHSPHDLFHL